MLSLLKSKLRCLHHHKHWRKIKANYYFVDCFLYDRLSSGVAHFHVKGKKILCISKINRRFLNYPHPTERIVTLKNNVELLFLL